MKYEITGDEHMRRFGQKLGRALRGGEFLELVGDVGAGKTTLTKGIALGLGIDETVQSPTFTISRTYEAPAGLRLVHYDFYRLLDAGIMKDELAEIAADQHAVTVVEWADVVRGVIPDDHLRISFTSTGDDSRTIELRASGERSRRLLEGIEG